MTDFEPREMGDTFCMGVILAQEDEDGVKMRFERNTRIALEPKQYAALCDTLAAMFAEIAERTRNEDAAPNN
ncbi:MAG: hypothetical protein OXL41_06370 [Nitrospinae bacterium]|nr:hypothetical protein [Nitrospinota bacterium]